MSNRQLPPRPELWDDTSVVTVVVTEDNGGEGNPDMGPSAEEIRPLLGGQSPSRPHIWQTALNTLSRLRDVLAERTIKATVAYMLATLATFVEVSHSRLGAVSYLAAVAILFFHPARTVGAMVEALLCCIVGLGTGFLVALGCLELVEHYEKKEKNIFEAHIIALGTLCVLTFVLAHIRAKWGTARPAIATGCTLCHILSFMTITQMSNPKALPVLPSKIVRTALSLFLGTLISFTTCCLVWPRTAAAALRRVLRFHHTDPCAKRADIVATLKHLGSFFNALSHTFSLNADSKRSRIVENEMGLESLPSAHVHESLNYAASIASQHEELQSLVKNHQSTLLHLETVRYEVAFEPTTSMFMHREDYKRIMESVERLTQHLGGLKTSIIQIDEKVALSSNHQALTDFMDKMGPSLRRLVVVCKQALVMLHHVFNESRLPARRHSSAILMSALSALGDSLSSALVDFDASQRKVLIDIYEGPINEDVFLVFFFVYALLEVGNEMVKMVDAVRSLKEHVIERREVGRVMVWWRQRVRRGDRGGGLLGSSSAAARNHRPGRSRSRRRAKPRIDPSHPTGVGRRDGENEEEPLVVRLWYFFRKFKKFEFLFALKTAITVTLMALPAFLEPTQALYYDFRMHWALTSFVAIMTPSVGGTNAAGLYRILGTLGGAATAAAVGWVFATSPLGQFCFSAMVALPSFYVFLNSKYPKIGQIFLLTYTAVLLNLSGKDPVTGKNYSVVDIAVRRATAVSVGVVIGLFVSWYIWPYTARKALRINLAHIFFDMGIIYGKVVDLFESDDMPPESLDEFLELELRLRLALVKQRELLPQTRHEPRLVGEFPTHVYGKIIDTAGEILDKFVAMRVAL
ncbi:hypothetical protein HK104_003210 [Borealophlyctis nickersoniae]|nr:hypothetical protein HK104_003210 [Borealophlyctis nickersoniae]